MEIFKIHSSSMSFNKGVDMNELIDQMEGFSGADIKSVCTEAGYFAIRANRTSISHDFVQKAIDKVKEERIKESVDFKQMFG